MKDYKAMYETLVKDIRENFLDVCGACVQAQLTCVGREDLECDSCKEPAQTVGNTVAEYLAEEEDEEARKVAKTEVAASIDEAIDEICYEPVEVPAKSTAKKPPLGVMPRGLFYEMRRDDLRRAICEYACEGLVINPEWVDEYNELVERSKR